MSIASSASISWEEGASGENVSSGTSTDTRDIISVRER